MEGRCPKCGAVLSLAAESGPVACHQCHEVFGIEALVVTKPPESGMLDYFGDVPMRAAEEAVFASPLARVAMQFVAGAVALGIAAGLLEPGPTLRQLAATLVAMGGLVGAGVGLYAVWRRRLGHVDKSLAITSVAMGILCIAAAVVLFLGMRF